MIIYDGDLADLTVFGYGYPMFSVTLETSGLAVE